MMGNLEHRAAGSLVTACILFFCSAAMGHPGHEESLSTSSPGGQVADLDEAGGRVELNRASRLRMIDKVSADFKRPAEGGPMMAFTGLLAGGSPVSAPKPEIAEPFQQFNRVKTRWDDQFLYVESDSLPNHPMMKGITAWQQQVPLPQPYTGENAWRIPLNPVPAKTPAMIRGHFLRGAIALAVNGIPIFNPQNNRGEISQEIGELDEWGGHCGRGDDYHYHAAPLHLQSVVGKGKPVAYALDGYPIYGLTEPDGSPVGKLDECHGHTTNLGYHYHAATKYPYVMSGFHGEVVERGGQVDPQPRDNPVRPAMQPLRGATITGLKSIGKDRDELTYQIAGHNGYVRYALNANGSYTFEYETPQGQKQEQTYTRRDGKSGPPGNEDRKTPAVSAPADKSAAPGGVNPAKENTFTLHSSEVKDGGKLPQDFSGDGSGATLPLDWSGAPAGTTSYAIIMHHIPGPGDMKWYWILYNIPADVQSIPKNVKGVGTLGNNSVNRRVGYAPPHSKGPGAKTYILTVYALSAEPVLTAAPAQVDRETLLAAMKDRILASAELNVVYDRTGVIDAGGNTAQPRPGAADGPANDGPRGGAFHLISREAEEKLNLTAEQQRSFAALTLETEGKLHQILTPAQVQALREARPPRRD